MSGPNGASGTAAPLPTPAPAAAIRAIALLAVVCGGLAAWCAVLWRRGDEGGGIERAELAMSDPELRKQAVEELVSRGAGIWDSFADPEVGRLLQPFLKDKDANGYHVTTNSFGLRERPFTLPKPAGTVRVVLLGDSFVMGHGVEQDDRLGVFLEQWLKEKSAAAHGSAAPSIEVLHVGAVSWNLASEAAFLRRLAGPMAADLVIQGAVRNDVEDNLGARGFGELASFNPLHPERGDTIFQSKHPTVAFQMRTNNWLAYGLDWESRSRFEDAHAAIVKLRDEVVAAGGRYLLLDYFTGLLPVSRHFLAPGLGPAEVAYLPSALIQDERFRLGKEDAHWNRAGHELAAKLLYSRIVASGLLPQLGLEGWPEADALAKEWLEKGAAEAAPEPDLTRIPARRAIDSRIDFAKLDEEHAAQVHGGIFGGAFVGPYSATILRCEGRTKLTLRGEPLGRRELDGTTVDIFVDEQKVGTIALADAAPFTSTFDVPAAIAARKFVSVRTQASNYAYGGQELRLHLVFHVTAVALE